MKSRRAALLVSLALLIGSLLAAHLPSAGAADEDGTNVIMIEVDGLEPKDVTRETTPFLWAMAHPQDPEVGQLMEDSRNGFTWQAPRAVMSAGTAANTGALLSGSYPEQSGVPADEFIDEDGTERLEKDPTDASQIGGGTYQSKLLLELVPGDDATGNRDAAAFVGNPALSEIANDASIPDKLKWWPSSDPANPDPQNPPSPAYCDLPRRVPENQDYRPPCSASDMVTLNKAVTALNDPSASRVAFTFIELAELGVIKRRDGDIAPPGAGEQSSPAAVDSVPHQLAQTDAAIAQFVQRYKDATQSPVTGPKWSNTFIMVVGSHGYETASLDKRLPAPQGAAESDLEAYVEADGRLSYSPYGSMATITANGATLADRQNAIESIAAKLKQGGPVEQACQAMPGGGKCIKEVLYVRDDVAVPASAGDAKLLSATHPDWHFDALSREDPFPPTRASGELLVITEPGWAAGRALPTQDTEGDNTDSQVPLSDASDPYMGVAGGPRNRAIAAIINGPGGDGGVQQVVPDRYPVTASPDTGDFDPNPTPKYAAAAGADPVTLANADPEDDTGAQGHERQPESIDFAPTIAALLKIGIDSDQLPDQARFLQEAFLRQLQFPNPDEAPPPPPLQCVDGIDNDGDGNVDLADAGCSSDQDDDESDDPLPPPPPPEVIVLPPPELPDPPPPPKKWDYHGLVRNLRAAVGDKRGHLFPNVRKGADLSYLVLRGDFGKRLSAVKLSFYKQVRSGQDARTGARRTVVKTLATFAPFSIRRAKNAKLTLKVPAVFKPTHVGVIVQQARKLTGRAAAVAKRNKQPLFKAYGARVGGIYRIKHARRLHTLAPKRQRPRRHG